MTYKINVDATQKSIISSEISDGCDVTIEKVINGVEITSIAKRAFYNKAMKSVDASKTIITNIADEAFLNCLSLKTIKFPETIVSFGINSFAVTGLTSFNVPKATTRFSGHTVNQSPYLNAFTVSSGNANFVALNNCVFSADYSVLYRIPIDMQFKDIPCLNKVEKIGGCAFSGCKLRSFVADSKLSTLDGRSLHACAKLKMVDLGLSCVTQLETETFLGTENISVLILPRTLTTINKNAMQSFKKLREIVIPESVILINDNGFGGLECVRHIYLLCQHQASFESNLILSNLINDRKDVLVHASESYTGSLFGGFSVQKDLLVALDKRMRTKYMCTLNCKHQSPSRSCLYFM